MNDRIGKDLASEFLGAERPFLAWIRTGVAILSLLPILCGCSPAHLGFLDPQGPVAAAQRDHFWVVIAAVSIVVLPVLILRWMRGCVCAAPRPKVCDRPAGG